MPAPNCLEAGRAWQNYIPPFKSQSRAQSATLTGGGRSRSCASFLGFGCLLLALLGGMTHFFRADVFHVRRNPPVIALRIRHATVPVAVKLRFRLADRCRAGVESFLVDGVTVLDIHIEVPWPGLPLV